MEVEGSGPIQKSGKEEAGTATSGDVKVGDASSVRGDRKKGKPILVVIIIIIITLLLGAGAWFLLRDPESDSDSDTISIDSGLSVPEVRDPTSTPVPTEVEVEVDRAEIRISVLNGTGIPQEAGFLQGILEDLGYVEIEVANADDQTNTTAVVTFASDLPGQIVDEITDELEDTYNSLETEQSSSLDDFDVVIITGLREGQELPTPEPEEEATPTPEVELSPTPTQTPTPTL